MRYHGYNGLKKSHEKVFSPVQSKEPFLSVRFITDKIKIKFLLSCIFSDYSYVRINKFLETDFTLKANVKKQRRFDRSTVILKLKDKICLRRAYIIINCKNANEVLTKTLNIYIETIRENRGNNGKNAKAKETVLNLN